MTTSFGPQGPNFTVTRPATLAQASGGTDTWAKDCSAAGAKDGTILDASFFNIIIANLREAINRGAITLDDSDTMLADAIQAIVVATLTGVFSAANGVKFNGTSIELALGDTTQSALTSATVAPVTDLIQIYDADAPGQAEITLYQAIKAVFASSTTGVAFDDAVGTITVSGITHTASVTAPATPSVGDEWYETGADRLFKYCTDGTSQFWREI